MNRHVVLGAIMGAGLLAITVFGQTAPLAANQAGPRASIDKIEKIAENLYWIPGAGGNSVVFVRGDGVLLVDTKLQNNGQALLDQIRKITDQPVTHIVNTHSHPDHTGSNAFFDAQVEVVTHENTKANMEKMPAFQSDSGKIGLPDRTINDRTTLFSGKDAVDLHYFGPAHTNGDILVVFRSARVMHAGDVFARKDYPLIDTNSGGSGVAFGETIAKAATTIRRVDQVLTGHGDVRTWQEFVDYGEFNDLVLSHARASLAAGKSAEQALTEFKLPAKFTGYELNPDRAGPGFRAPPGGNFAVIYQELRK